MACIYIWREENNNNNSHPKLNMCIFLFLYFEIKRLPRYPHLSPLQRGHSLPKRKQNLMHRNILLRISCLLQRVLRHISYAFSPRSRKIQPNHLATSRQEETNANGVTKWRQISKTWKPHQKNRFWSESKFFSGNVIALCVDLDGKKNSLRPL